MHGVAYFRDLLSRLEDMRAGDMLLFTDWRGDPDQHLDGAGHEVGARFAAAARRGVLVRGLVWRSHLDKLAFSASQNRHLGQEIIAAGGQCALDMRVRPLGSHHQKAVVLRHPGRPLADIAYVGGIDLCHSRRDDESHLGDSQRQTMAACYGERPPWHDAQLAITGPAVGDVETVFRERWDDPAPLSRSPIRMVANHLRRGTTNPGPLPPQLPDPPECGEHAVQILRTYPVRHPGYPFAPQGERSVARGYAKAIGRAARLIYLEDQYLWSVEAAILFAAALRRSPELRMIVVIPGYPDQDGSLSMAPNLVSRAGAIAILRKAGGSRVAVYALENHHGTPVYVHAKICSIDDRWVTVGSDNVNRRSWTHDSELTCAVMTTGATQGGLARQLRLQLAAEHLDLADERAATIVAGDPHEMFDAFTASAVRLDAWHAVGSPGPRPPGRLRAYTQASQGAFTHLWSSAAYRIVYDPDGRTPLNRWRGRY
jgi:phosphatidylserine/phosphatidylglycerophosphate/cardiolipin synthase-like enzyme